MKRGILETAVANQNLELEYRQRPSSLGNNVTEEFAPAELTRSSMTDDFAHEFECLLSGV